MSRKLPKSVQFVKGVGPHYQKILNKLGIETVEDLLSYYPRDYQDRSTFVPIKNVKPGQEATIKGEVLKVDIQKPRSGLSLLKVSITDNTDVINGIWFNQPYLKKKFKKGETYIFSGEVSEKSWRFRKKEINNPVFEKIEKGDTIHTGRVVPIYPLTNGLTQKRLREIIYHALHDYACHLNDLLPEYIKKKYKFSCLEDSIIGLHFPENRQHYITARKRIAFEELFLLQLLVLRRKKGMLKQHGIIHKDQGVIINNFLNTLSFELTDAQKKVWCEIKNDMEKGVPMQRLLQGDVGSGKTVIAALAMIETISNGYQGIYMAPTEILAEQHFLNFKKMLSGLEFKIDLLVGGQSKSERNKLINWIKERKVDLIIGTHALFQEDIEYSNPGLVVIDEQHRFGVEQRYQLKRKGGNPDLLVMTATPIPRTLALTLYGDLDLSIIDEMPPGRSPVITTWRTQKSRAKIYNFVKEKLDRGQQAYVVCPLIEPSEKVDAVSAVELFEELSNNIFIDYEIGILHSQVSAEEKTEIMEDFRMGKIRLLVSTTVIEVGVDVPNATIMIIENAERFGLAQLHQLRGRVGRGPEQSYCILIGTASTKEGKRRLSVMTETTDGFDIADEDLKIRGPGEFFGTKQHGIPDLKIADIIKDSRLIGLTRQEASVFIEKKDWEKRYQKLKKKLDELKLKV